MARKIYKIPATFYLDHINRDCGDTDVIIRQTKNVITVELDKEGFDDLLSDADYYWFCRDEICDRQIAQSAKRTMQVLKMAGAPS
jgi:hypothetical protein